jgi:hypothetical protein
MTVHLTDAAGATTSETYATRREAHARARQYVTRDGLNTYRTQRRHAATRYYHSYGEREALVVEDDT